MFDLCSAGPASKLNLRLPYTKAFVWLLVFMPHFVASSSKPATRPPQLTTLGPQSHQHSSPTQPFKDPLVWDVGSLYKPDRSAIKRRFKRSQPPQQHQQLNPSKSAYQMVDSCQSKMEILTPYYATNSKGQLRTVVNSELMQQAIQIETCVRTPQASHSAPGAIGKCNLQPECGCEQKHKWHRLLVLDPSDLKSTKGLFMDWFLFPSSCVCRCKTSPLSSSKQFLRTVKRLDTS